MVEVHLMHNSESLMALILLLEFYQSQKSIMVSKMSFYNFLLYLGLSLTLNLNSYLILFFFLCCHMQRVKEVTRPHFFDHRNNQKLTAEGLFDKINK